jgi:hypothetical protein
VSIGQIVRFHDERFFEGAVQLSWVERREELARQAAEAFVFHGPRYHGAGDAEREGVEGGYRLKDTASFVRDLLESMSSNLSEHQANPYWLAVAGYGSGKSHLALTCSMLLSHPTGETAATIVNQLAQADPEIGKAVEKLVAEMDRPALVIPLDGMSGFHLGNELSRSVFQQLRNHGVDAGAIRDLSPRFLTAEQFVDRNFAIRADSFGEYLPGMKSELICTQLRENDEEIYSAVDKIYSTANGHSIPVEGQESAQDLIDTLCSVYCGSDGVFSGVVILFDEFGRYLEYASEKPQLAGDSALQQIFQGVQDNSAKIRFVGFIQYELKAYLKRFSGADLRQLQRYITRFETAEKLYLSTNLETIFAHMIGKDEQALSRLWEETNAENLGKQTWQLLSPLLPEFARYPVWNDPESFIGIIVKGCWPLHPFAVWFLTRQQDLVQSRSALNFIKDVIERIANDDEQVDGRLRQVSAAELVIGSMLPELISAERETGGTTAEALQALLEKFDGHLDSQQRLILAGVAIIKKARVGKQTREMANALLCEAATIDPLFLPEIQEALSELGAVEWDDDLGQYELLTDGASRGQFQQWLRAQLAQIDVDGVRDLFIRRGRTDIRLDIITPDFAQSRDISTTDWFFEADLAHLNTLDTAIQRASADWQSATSHKDAKGRVIYLYIHSDDDVIALGRQVQTALDAELGKIGLPQIPIWVIGIEDKKGMIADHIGRLYLFEELMSEADQDRFRRFVSDEQERSRNILNESGKEAIRDRLFWIAGFSEVPGGRLSKVGNEIFGKVYSDAIPFPFDGFASAAGGGPMDAVQLARGLIAGQVNGPWVQTQTKKLQNRVNAVLVQSWKGLSPNGKLVQPMEPKVSSLLNWMEKNHRDDPQWTLLSSYRSLIAPPYGMNASSACVLLGLFLGLDSPPRRVEQDGELVSSAEWIQRVFPSKRGQHYLEQDVLAKSRIRFLSDDSEGRWRNYFTQWEAEKNFEKIVEFGSRAENMREVDPLPEAFEGNFRYLIDATKVIENKLLAMSAKIEDWQLGIEKAERRASIEHSIRIAGVVLTERANIEESSNWPESNLRDCNLLLAMAMEQISEGIDGWISRQNCRSSAQVVEFRQQKEKEANTLSRLGLQRKSEALINQVQSSIAKVEELQNFSLTLAHCEDFPRQPEVTNSTTVRYMRDEIRRGDELITGIHGARRALSEAEISAYTAAIKLRQEKLKAGIERQKDALGSLYDTQLNDSEVLRETLTKINHLREIFVDSPDQSDVNELAVQLHRIISDFSSWENSDVAVERLEEILERQVAHQLGAMEKFLEEKDIEPVWDLSSTYKSLLSERIQIACQRSDDWMRSRLNQQESIASFDQTDSELLQRELSSVPSYLSKQHSEQIGKLAISLENRIAELKNMERLQKILDWQEQFLEAREVENLDRVSTEKLLAEIRNPPYEMLVEELKQIEPITSRLTAHLDQISMDDLFRRIELLKPEIQKQLLKRLSALLNT